MRRNTKLRTYRNRSKAKHHPGTTPVRVLLHHDYDAMRHFVNQHNGYPFGSEVWVHRIWRGSYLHRTLHSSNKFGAPGRWHACSLGDVCLLRRPQRFSREVLSGQFVPLLGKCGARNQEKNQGEFMLKTNDVLDCDSRSNNLRSTFANGNCVVMIVGFSQN